MTRKIKTFEFDDSDIAGHLIDKLSTVFSAEIEVCRIPFPKLSEIDRQYDAREVLGYLVMLRKEDDDIVIGITGSDLMIPGFNFVFGLAERSTMAAVISVSRLKCDNYDKFQERCLKEAIHEIGHLISLNHCDDPLCVMHFSNSLLDTDVKSYEFCKDCAQQLFNSQYCSR